MIELLHIDCMEYMAGLPDKAFDLAIVDPPYGINAPIQSPTPTPTQRNRLQRLNGGGGKLKNRVLNTSKNINWDDAIPSLEYFSEIERVSANRIVWGGNYFPLPPTRCVVVWDKVQPWENFSQVEIAWTSFDRPAPLFRFDNRTGGKIHPTQKPITLYRWLLEKFSDPGQLILDTHLGSGSSAIAAHYFGCDFVGTELDPDYYAAAVKRFHAETAQIGMEFA